MTYIEEAYGWLRYAEESLRAARDTSEIGHIGLAVNRAYYAAFYAAKGVIAAHRQRDPKTHSGVNQRFGELAVTKSDFPPEIASILGALAGQRGQADYDLGYRESLTSEDVTRSIADAGIFVAAVHAWFERHHANL